jgi:endonuclease YncB( thermonuclease family)
VLLTFFPIHQNIILRSLIEFLRIAFNYVWTSMPHAPSFAGFTHPRGGGVFVAAAVIFGLGLAAGAMVRPALAPRAEASVAASPPVAGAGESTPPVGLNAQPELQHSYPAALVRVLDGDTFEARVQVWPGLEVDTKVRLRGIDAPELHARCDDERVRAEAARAALTTILAEGGVAISRVGIDKYGGRVDAAVSTRNTTDVSAALLNGGWARSYDGGRRGSWC